MRLLLALLLLAAPARAQTRPDEAGFNTALPMSIQNTVLAPVDSAICNCYVVLIINNIR